MTFFGGLSLLFGAVQLRHNYTDVQTSVAHIESHTPLRAMSAAGVVSEFGKATRGSCTLKWKATELLRACPATHLANVLCTCPLFDYTMKTQEN